VVQIEQRRHRDHLSFRRVTSRTDDRVRNAEISDDLKQFPTHSGIGALEFLSRIQQARDRRTEHAVHLSKATARHFSAKSLIRVSAKSLIHARRTEVINVLHRFILVCGVIETMSTGNIDVLHINIEIRIGEETFAATQPRALPRSGAASSCDGITRNASPHHRRRHDLARTIATSRRGVGLWRSCCSAELRENESRRSPCRAACTPFFRDRRKHLSPIGEIQILMF
jgi:hypothetical protein